MKLFSFVRYGQRVKNAAHQLEKKELLFVKESAWARIELITKSFVPKYERNGAISFCNNENRKYNLRNRIQINLCNAYVEIWKLAESDET